MSRPPLDSSQLDKLGSENNKLINQILDICEKMDSKLDSIWPKDNLDESQQEQKSELKKKASRLNKA